MITIIKYCSVYYYKCKKSFTICIYYVFRKKEMSFKRKSVLFRFIYAKMKYFLFFLQLLKRMCYVYIGMFHSNGLFTTFNIYYFIIHLLNMRYNIYYLLKNSLLRKLRINNNIYKHCLYLQCTFQ